MLDIFHTLAEVAVAITGFSSLIIIFRGSIAWSRQDYVSFSFVLSWSIGSIFLSLLPIVLVEFGAALATASQVGLFSAIVYMCAVGALLTRVQTRVLKEGGGGVHTRSKLLMGLSFCSIVLIAFTAGIGVLPGPQHAWFAATIVFLMAHATADLGVFVVQSTRRNQPG